MNRATELTARALGVYAGLVALQHGIGEILQGDRSPIGMMIHAIGSPCQPEAVWHACLPAMTVLPTMRLAGAGTIAAALFLVGWSAMHRARKHRHVILGSLSLVMLLAGGGFVAPFVGLVAAGGAFLSRGAEEGWRRRVPSFAASGLAALWPGTLIGLWLWLPGGWLLGHLFPALLLRVSVAVFLLVDLLLPILTVLAALARDGYVARRTEVDGT